MIEMMAIGDSVYNGVRSLNICKELSEMSVPAQVARAFGWDFKAPEYPRVILADLEKDLAALRDGKDPLEDLPTRAIDNIRDWVDAAINVECWHNLAVAQFTTKDLSDRTSADCTALIQKALKQANKGPPRLDDLPDLYEAINRRFILNPSGDSRRANLSAVGLINEQRPKRVLVHVGPNDGLWTLALTANADGFEKMFNRESWQVLAKGLAACDGVETIYVNLLPRPRTIANLVPDFHVTGDSGLPRSDGYYENYVSALLNTGGISGDQMKAVDEFVRDRLNPGIKAIFERDVMPRRRVAFVDLYAATSRLDAKHFQEPDGRIILMLGGEEKHITNHPLNWLPDGFGFGGFYGLDNLHPSLVGYGVIAREVCRVIEATEGTKVQTPIDLQRCADRDTLLQAPPGKIDPFKGIANLLAFAGAYFRA